MVIPEFCGESLELSAGYRDRNERHMWTLVCWGRCAQMKGPVTLGGLGSGVWGLELGGAGAKALGVCAEWEGLWVDVEVVGCSHKETECPAGQLGGPDLGPQRCLCPICAAV